MSSNVFSLSDIGTPL